MRSGNGENDMNEHIKKILEHKYVYYIHIAVYFAIILLNAEIIFVPQVRGANYHLPAAIVFASFFVFLLVIEMISHHRTNDFIGNNPVGLIYRIIQLVVTTVFYFLVPDNIGVSACLTAVILFSVELMFYIQFDELFWRVLVYSIFGISLAAMTAWRMTHYDSVFRSVNLAVSVAVVILSVVIICEWVAGLYNYFTRLLFAQNRTVENLNVANDKLKEQQEEIKKTNDKLGRQKIELQAANKKINRAHDEMSVENEIATAVTSTVELEDLLEKVSRIIRVRLDMDFAGVVLEPDSNLAVPGEDAIGRKIFSSTVFGKEYLEHMENLLLSGEADDILELSQTYVQNMEADNNRLNRGVKENQVLESVVVVPLKKQEERLGNLVIGKRTVNAFMDNKAFYENIGSQLSIGISNMRLYEQMHEMAIRDGLTKIYNRRHLTELLNTYLSEAMQKKIDVSLALFDIDKFKLVNDTYGHQCGDAVIRHVATLLNRAALENGGIAGRYGGEEFVIAFQGKTLDEVYRIVEEVHAKIKAEDVTYEDKVLNVRASAGVASYPETCKNPAELLTRADAAMYYSKQNGRDRITIDSEELKNII